MNENLVQLTVSYLMNNFDYRDIDRFLFLLVTV